MGNAGISRSLQRHPRQQFLVTPKTPPPALAGERIIVKTPAGDMTVYVAGEGPPLLLIHSINAAASAAEMRPLQHYYRQTRQVFCMDLPGYGLSSRPNIEYSPRLMTDAIRLAADEIQRRRPGPLDALAVSLSCEFLSRAAVEMPAAFRSLALVSPTGFKGGVTRRGAPGSTLGMPWLNSLLRGPGWGRQLFGLLTRPNVIRYFLQKTWGSKHIDLDLWAYDIVTARCPGAEYAPLRFISGYLFSGDIHDVYDKLSAPTWMSHGVRGDFTNYGYKSLVASRPNWQIAVFDSGALPYFERPQEFFSAYDSFLAASKQT